MQNTTNVTNYDSLFSQNARRQIQVIIYKTSQTHYTFGEDKIISCSTSAALFSQNTFSLGGCVAKRLNLRFYPGANRTNIPPMAKVRLQLRLTDGTTTSDWINKGTFFVDTRKYDQMTGIMELECFDAMLKSEEYFIQNDDNTWPRRMRAVATDIATRMGLTIENASLIPNNDNYLVQLPMDYSMREILANIGVACGGNWTVTDSGDKLRFCSVGYSSGEADIGKQCSSFTIGDQFDTFSKVIMNLDDNTYVESGDTTGRTLEVYCAWGSQTICNALLGIVSHLYYPYRPYEAKNAYINPAMELNDYIDVTASGSSVAYLVASIDMNYDALCLADLSAPTDDEIDHEYPTQTPSMQEVARQVRTAEASISVLSSEIALKVSYGDVINAINISTEGITIDTSKLNISGVITAINNNSTTTIDGGKITTGSITATQIDVSTLRVGELWLNKGSSSSPIWEDFIWADYVSSPAEITKIYMGSNSHTGELRITVYCDLATFTSSYTTTNTKLEIDPLFTEIRPRSANESWLLGTSQYRFKELYAKTGFLETVDTYGITITNATGTATGFLYFNSSKKLIFNDGTSNHTISWT